MVTQTSETTTQSNGTVRLPTDEWHRLLADGRRRDALRELADQELPVELSALAAAVAERRDGAEDPAGVSVSLHHVHLPKLAQHGVVEYDPESNRVVGFRAPDVAKNRL